MLAMRKSRCVFKTIKNRTVAIIFGFRLRCSSCKYLNRGNYVLQGCSYVISVDLHAALETGNTSWNKRFVQNNVCSGVFTVKESTIT